MKHALIIGLTRTGTTFLTAYYGKLGFKIGYSNRMIDKLMMEGHRIHGGLEFLNEQGWEARRKVIDNELEIIKSPWIYASRKPPWHTIEKLRLKFKYILITERDYNKQAKSLVGAKLRMKKLRNDPNKLKEIESQVLKAAPIKMEALNKWAANTSSEIIKVKFPDSVLYFEYLWEQLKPTMREITKEKAYDVWRKLKNPNYITVK